MATPDYDVIKEIPGYKVILKSVLKSQIQQLVEQLASTTDEESVILTASVSDGTLSHLGSDSGKGFLEDHEDIKSQFLGFCLKKHHRKKQEEKERQEAEALQQSMQASPQRMGGPRGLYGMRSPRFPSPRGPAHPVSMIRASPGGRMGGPGVRHEPYPLTRPRRSPLNFDPGRGPGSGLGQGPLRKSLDGQIIKIEPDDDNSNQSESDKPGSTNQSPSHTPSTPSNVKSESGSKDTDDDAQSESSNSNIPNEQASETNIGLDSDLSNLISGSNTESAEVDPNVTVKLEALTETEMELEITGVEPGRSLVPQDNWDPNASMGMNFDPTGATGSQGDMSQQGYSFATKDYSNVSPLRAGIADDYVLLEGCIARKTNMVSNCAEFYKTSCVDGRIVNYVCVYENCCKTFPTKQKIERHVLVHTGEKPFQCVYCNYKSSRKDQLKVHQVNQHYSEYKQFVMM